MILPLKNGPESMYGLFNYETQKHQSLLKINLVTCVFVLCTRHVYCGFEGYTKDIL